MLPHICGVPYLHVNRPLLNWAVIFMVHTIKWKLSLLQTPPLRTVSLVPNTASFIHTLPSNKGHTSRLCKHLTLSLSDHFESPTPSVTSESTRRPVTPLPENWVVILVGWLSNRSHYYVYLWAILARLLIFRGSNACLELKKKMAIFIVNSKIALVFETMTC